ncbi:serine protease [Bacteriovorax stolpii]|uniref:Serine protease n=1 Tax=Bacteriovorax stolpii TaxID=960 RepID=A0A2K9NND0_BACTC|nr:S8 family serine peptidase [Bacteriovorax stolpii]AUN97029.1 serine protease [Bacteriovorax stolpii]TDP53316.1 PA domain-containing protein [Bacteriovorax stolpii]
MKYSASLLLSLALLASCAPKNSNQSSLDLIASKYFSMRQQTPTQYVGIVQLSHPALLAEAQTVDGKPVIDEELKKAILDEQEEVISKLKDISPDIKIVATYKMVLNAVAFVAPSEVAGQIEGIEGVNKLIQNTNFARPQTVGLEKKVTAAIESLKDKNSVSFIGADKAHKMGISGQKMRVGVIDTGIDYTHAMLGGTGKKETYDSIDPSAPNDFFPNAKVVGGADFVGSKYSAGGASLEQQVPVRDENPIDESGHGSHVAGSVAGIGDNIVSYSGVAPEAALYALKVFGKEGSTSDIAVIQALEYAADPSEKIEPTNRLDVVNLSLGGGFGKPKILYTEAIKNLTKAGTIVVASAGNSGDNPYITGAPATSDEAISVAASIDYMPQNIAVPAVEVSIEGASKLVEKVEGNGTIPADSSKVSGALVHIGTGVEAISEEVKTQVKGRIALMDRGAISFEQKFQVAKALGASGVVMVNNVDGAPIAMGSEGKYDFPAVMVTKSLGDAIKAALAKKSEVVFNFSPGQIINRDDLIDTMTNFSSRGPRSIDSLIKPEISGPGANVISAAFGTGAESVQFSGTSMSGPHLAGVMALMRQAFPKASVQELKARILNTAKIMMANGAHVAVSRQGAGRVQVEEALKAKVLAMPATLSLGEVPVASTKTVSKKVTLTNSSDKDVLFSTRAINSKNIKVSLQSALKVKAKSSLTFTVSFTLARENAAQNNIEADGFVILTNADDGSKVSLPFLAVLNKVSDIKASDLVTQTDSKVDRNGSEVKVTLTNSAKSSGDALIFNLLGTDERKTVLNPNNMSASTLCDLEAAGIRIIEKTDKGQTTKVLQVGVKLYDAMTFWQPCDISLQIDANNDGIADQELLAIKANYVSGITADIFASLLLDAEMARNLRMAFEMDPANTQENYLPAILDAREMKFYNHSNVAVVEADLSKIAKGKNGKVGIKLSVTHLEADSKGDDFLANHGEKWQSLNLAENSLAFYDMPEVVTVGANDLEHVSMRRGLGNMRALVLYPHNSPAALKDQQSQILVEKLLK